jgi:hypothetical protein
MLLTIIGIIVLCALLAMGKLIRDISADLSGMDESTKSVEERKEARLRKEIEKWREGK